MKNLSFNTLRILVAMMTMLLASCQTHPSDQAAQTPTSSVMQTDTSSATHTDTITATQAPSGEHVPAKTHQTLQSNPLPKVNLSSADNGKTVTLKKGQKIELTLRNPGDGGYAFNEPEVNASLLKLDSHMHRAAPKDALPGNFGEDVWVFSAIGAGTADLAITASRSWEKGKKSTSFSAKLQIQ